MRILATLVLLFAPIFAFNTTHAVEASAVRTYTCQLTGDMKGASIGIGIGGQYIHGRGYLSCRNNKTKQPVQIPVKLQLIGAGVGLEVSIVKRVHLQTAGIGVKNPNVFFRSYAVGASAGGTLIRAGVEFDTAFRVNTGDAGGAGFEVGLQGRDAVGLGVHLHGMTFKISAI